MLKIKDDVDLKELEKFGFIYNQKYNDYERAKFLGLYTVTTRVFLDNPNYKKNELVCESSIWYDLFFTDSRILWVNEDLDKAGLLEEIEE